jgi:hypothetical protein
MFSFVFSVINAVKMSSVPPFIGSLYSEETGLFDRTIISDVSLRTTGLKIKENGFDLDIVSSPTPHHSRNLG